MRRERIHSTFKWPLSRILAGLQVVVDSTSSRTRPTCGWKLSQRPLCGETNVQDANKIKPSRAVQCRLQKKLHSQAGTCVCGIILSPQRAAQAWLHTWEAQRLSNSRRCHNGPLFPPPPLAQSLHESSSGKGPRGNERLRRAAEEGSCRACGRTEHP